MDAIDAWVEDEGEASRLGDGGLAVLSTKGDFTMRPSKKLWFENEISNAVDY
jgi:hypothetical protein